MNNNQNILREKINKYIIFKDGRVDIFDRTKIHSFRAGSREVVSAGFWNGEEAYGESTTLGVKSRPEDTEIIRQYLLGNK